MAEGLLYAGQSSSLRADLRNCERERGSDGHSGNWGQGWGFPTST